MSEKVLAGVGIALWLIVVIGGLCCIPSCAYFQRVGDAIFSIEPEPKVVPIPDTPKKQMWETIKGMTPNWLAIPVIALGGVAMWYGAFKLGIAFVIFGSINLFMALATSRFGFWMALCGLIGSVAAVLASMVAKNKALKEIVCGTQKVKQTIEEAVDSTQKIDSIYDETKEILKKQAKSTKNIVAKIKTKMKLKGEM